MKAQSQHAHVRLARLVLLALLAGATAGLAQQTGEEAEEISGDPEEQNQVESPAASPSPEPADANTSSDDSPFDYKSSEKISEDLSVSYPVDI